MRVIHDISEMKSWVAIQRQKNSSVGFVPTMGALHMGHLTLVEQSQRQNDVTVVSIFVNPTQFDNADDLKSYPDTLERDQVALYQKDVDVLFVPGFKSLYPDEYRFQVEEKEISRQLCGAHRQGHFNGVLTVVMKLLNIVRPHSAYFGEKDFQQLQLIKDMVETFFMDCRIQSVPTVREDSGLAMSSRNLKLKSEHMVLAPRLHEVLKTAASVEDAKSTLSQLGFRVDYVEEWRGRRLAAAYLDDVRLIDNVEI